MVGSPGSGLSSGSQQGVPKTGHKESWTSGQPERPLPWTGGFCREHQGSHAELTESCGDSSCSKPGPLGLSVSHSPEESFAVKFIESICSIHNECAIWISRGTQQGGVRDGSQLPRLLLRGSPGGSQGGGSLPALPDEVSSPLYASL